MLSIDHQHCGSKATSILIDKLLLSKLQINNVKLGMIQSSVKSLSKAFISFGCVGYSDILTTAIITESTRLSLLGISTWFAN